LDIIILYILIITFSALIITFVNLNKSKSTIKHVAIPLLTLENTENNDKIVCVPKYLNRNNDVVKKALILKWLKDDGNSVTPNEPVVELLIGRTIFEGVISNCGKLILSRHVNDIISGGSEICRLFSCDNKFEEHSFKNDYECKSKDEKFSFVLETPYIDGLKASSIRITKWYKKSGDFVYEKEIIGSHIINECKEGVDHAFKTGIIKIYKSENDYLKDGELVYEIFSGHHIDKIVDNSKSVIRAESNIHANEFNTLTNNEKINIRNTKDTSNNGMSIQINNYNKIESNGSSIYCKIELLKNKLNSKSYSGKDIIGLLEELLIKEELRVIIYKIALKIIESKSNARENKGAEENAITQENKNNAGIIKPSEIKFVDEKDINVIDVSTYDVKINSDKLKTADVINNKNDIETKGDNTHLANYVTGKELLQLKNDIFNLKESKVSSSSNIEPDNEYPDDNFELNNFWLKLPRIYSNTFTDTIKQSEALINDIYLKIINIYDSLFKEKGTNILRALKLSNKNIAILEKIREEELKLGYSIYYYNNSSYYNKILNIFYYTHRTAQLVLKLKHGFKVNIEDNLFILSELGLENYRVRIIDCLNELTKDIPDPDLDTEIKINKLNTARWKAYYNDIKEKKDIGNYNKVDILNSLKKLIAQNKKNYNLKNIYYSSAKLLIDISILDSSYYFALYKILSGRAGVETKPVPSALKKKLIKCGNDTYIEYEKILAGLYNLNTKRDNKKLLNDILKLFKKERKIIEIDKSKIATAEEAHLRIKNKLDQILSWDEQLEKEKENVKTVLPIKNATNSSKTSHLDNVQRELIKLMIEKGNSLSEEEVKIFAQKFKLPHNYLINSVNEYFYEKLNDNLIVEEDAFYLLNNDYYEEIKKIIYYGEI